MEEVMKKRMGRERERERQQKHDNMLAAATTIEKR